MSENESEPIQSPIYDTQRMAELLEFANRMQQGDFANYSPGRQGTLYTTRLTNTTAIPIASANT